MKAIQVDTSDIKRLLANLEASLQRPVLYKALTTSAKPVQAEAKANAGKINPSRKTYKLNQNGERYTLYPGTIARSISILRMNRAKNPQVHVAAKAGKGGSYGRADGWFAHFIHDGTKARQTKKGENRGAIKADKSVKFNDVSDSVMEQAAQIFSREVDKIIGKL